MKRYLIIIFLAILTNGLFVTYPFAATHTILPVSAQQRVDVKSRSGANASLIESLRASRIIELNFTWNRNSPLFPLNPPFEIGLQTSHKQSFGQTPGGIAFATDMMFFSGQHGAPSIDAIGHVSNDLRLFGGVDAVDSVDGTGLKVLGIEAYPRERFVNRAVLLDVARFKGVEVLAAGQEITVEDLEATAREEGVEIQPGDSVLIRTGYGKFFNSNSEKYLGFRPGPGEEAALWLADKKVFLTGDDQLSFEVVPERGTIFPVHRILVAERGIYIVENLNLEELSVALSEQKVYEFPLVLNPPRLGGATGAPVNAFAILPQ